MKLVSIIFYPEPPPIFYKDIERFIFDRRTEEQIFHACQSVSNPTSSKRKVSIVTQFVGTYPRYVRIPTHHIHLQTKHLQNKHAQQIRLNNLLN